MKRVLYGFAVLFVALVVWQYVGDLVETDFIPYTAIEGAYTAVRAAAYEWGCYVASFFSLDWFYALRDAVVRFCRYLGEVLGRFAETFFEHLARVSEATVKVLSGFALPFVSVWYFMCGLLETLGAYVPDVALSRELDLTVTLVLLIMLAFVVAVVSIGQGREMLRHLDAVGVPT